LTTHLQVERYGDFWLTNAIRPSVDLQVIPRAGYRIDTYRDPRSELRIPALAAAVSREMLFDVFLDLLDPLGEVVDVILETSHDSEGAEHRDLYREHVDLPVLKSYFCDFEDVLLHDGCAGVAVIAGEQPVEVQFDEHKLLVVYSRNLKPFERILQSHDIPRDDQLKLITEGEHLHSTDRAHARAFEQLCHRLGVTEAAARVSW
jgi:hypothetical protein